MNIEESKKAAGYLAASFVEKKMIVGLGTGSTAYYFIEKLIERNSLENLEIRAIASSSTSSKQALAGGIQLVDINEINYIDLTVDGADEIDKQKRMIKGGGGALLREKMLASMSKEMIVVVDETKLTNQLGHKKLPVEVIPFGNKITLHKIEKLGLRGELRKDTKTIEQPYVTDNGNYIIDIHFSNQIENPEQLDLLLKEIPGVVETGFFFNLAGRVIIAFKDGQTLVLS